MPSRSGTSDQTTPLTSAEHAGAEGYDLRLRPHLGHAGVGHMHNSALSGNRTNRLPPKRQHGSEHHMDRATDGEGDGARGDGDHRKCSDDGGHA